MSNVIQVPDISVVCGGALHSLREQRVVKSGESWIVNEGAGVMKNGILYVLGDNCLVTMTTAAPEASVYIELNSPVTVDWGDGMREIFEYVNTYNHTYTDNAEYIIKITGRTDALKEIVIANGNVTSVIAKCAGLVKLAASWNQIVNIEVSGCPNLEKLLIENNQLATVDVTKLRKLKELSISANQLAGIDISKNTQLTSLSAGSNLLTDVDLSCNSKLESIYLGYSEVSVLGISNNPLLNDLNLYSTPLMNDLSKVTALASALPDRTGQPAGTWYVNNQATKEAIDALCETKNWSIT